MKLASYADGSREGHLVVVAADLASCHYASQSVGRLQGLLDDWNFLSPQLEDLAATLNGGKARHALPFDANACRAPVARPPRCVREVEPAPAPQGEEPVPSASPPLLLEEPAWFAGPRLSAGPSGPERWHPHLAVITADLPFGADVERTAEAVRLYGWAVRPGADDPVGPWHFAPVLVTPGDARLQATGWAWETADGGRGEARRAARGSPAGACAPRIASPARIAEALARAAARAPLPAGSVLLLPLGEPETHPPGLALVDAAGEAVFGRIQVGPGSAAT